METNEGGSASPEPEPKIVGITGGIGSGKSTVARYIEEMGFPIYYSDQRAKDIVNEDPFLKDRIIEILGNEAYDDNGFYDRQFVSSVVFNDQQLLDKLNATIHPAVKQDFERWIQRQNSEFLFKETALLFELGLDRNCYKTVLVTAEDNLRIKRVMDRDGKTYREVETIISKQMPEKDKCKRADFIILNNTDLEELKEQTNLMMEKLTRL